MPAHLYRTRRRGALEDTPDMKTRDQEQDRNQKSHENCDLQLATLVIRMTLKASELTCNCHIPLV